MRSTVPEMKNALSKINRYSFVEEKLVTRRWERCATLKHGKKKKKKRLEKMNCELWDNFKHPNIYALRAGNGWDSWRNNGRKTSQFDGHYKPTDLRVQWIPNTRNIKNTTPRHVIIKLLNTSDKGKNLKSSQRKKSHYTQRNKDKDDGRFLIRNNTSWKTAEKFF